MRNIPMIFENHEVEIIEVNGQILFNPRHVALCLDIEFKTAQNYMSCMNEKQVIKITNDSISRLTGFRKIHNTGENFLTEAGVYKLIFKSRKPEAERFQDWVTDVVLPAIRKTGSYNAVGVDVQFDMALKASHMAYSILRASDSARIAGISRVCDAFNVSTVGLPKYLPREAQILSATELLKRNGKPMTVHAFNFKMLSEGLLEIQTRPSTSGSEVRKFKALTEEGKAYGENSVNPDYPLETQPHYFSDKFSELLERLNKTVLSDD